MTVIISGSNGFIGSSLVKKFHDEGYDVVSIVKDKNENIEYIKDYSTIIYNDFSNISELIERLKIYSNAIFYHLAWIGVNGALKADYNSQIQNIKMACDAAYIASEIKAKRFLVSGTIAERAVESYPLLDKLSGGLMYSTSKTSAHLFIETYCKNVGLEYVWMQFSNIYGPKNKTGNLVSYTLTQINNNQEATFGPAQQPYDFIFVDDLISAVYKLGIANKLSKNLYFLGSGDPRILQNYLLTIGQIAGKESLIKIGSRPDDGIIYSFDMFSNEELVRDIGIYVTKSFEQGILETIKEF